MKKSLLIISTSIIILFFLTSCQSNQVKKTNSKDNKKELKKDTNTTESSGLINRQSESVDTSIQHDANRGIDHPAPNQSKIDSIKRAKTIKKSKNKSD